MQLLDEIKEATEKDVRDLGSVYGSLKAMGVQMFMTNSMTKEQVIAFCSGLIRLYEGLKPKE